mgnify:CR=1 FL=1
MKVLNTIFLSVITLLLAGCAGFGMQPNDGSMVIAQVHHIFTEDEYQSVAAANNPANDYQKNVIFPMMRAGINEGVTLEDVLEGRFVISMCKCGAQCYARYPTLLPNNTSPAKYDVVKLETGITDWHSQDREMTYTLSSFISLLDIPWDNRPESRSCNPAEWPT